MDSDNRTVLKFRPRRLSHPSAGMNSTLNDPQVETNADDYRHRMITNAAALAFTVILAGAGIWLAVKMAEMRTSQDCVLMGRKDCAHISTTARP